MLAQTTNAGCCGCQLARVSLWPARVLTQRRAERPVSCLNRCMAWKLDPREVGRATSASSSGPFRKGPTRHRGTPALRELTLRLVHLPTGITTAEETAVGPFTRKQKREAEARLYADLFPVLEDKVARALRIPGR
jgi:hypothetical protein